MYAAAEPYALWQRFAGIWAEAALSDLGNGFSVATAGGELLVLDRPSAEACFAPVEMPYGWRDLPCAVAIAVRVADVNRVHLMMMQNRVPHLRLAELVRIPPSHAGNSSWTSRRSRYSRKIAIRTSTSTTKITLARVKWVKPLQKR